MALPLCAVVGLPLDSCGPLPFAMEELVPGRIACGDDLRAWMKKHDVTQARLAALSGMNAQTINRNLKRSESRPSFLVQDQRSGLAL